MILNDNLNEEIGELRKELDKLYSLDNTKPQKMIKTIGELEQKIDILNKEKKELEQKINIVETSSNTINNELTHAVYILRTKCVVLMYKLKLNMIIKVF